MTPALTSVSTTAESGPHVMRVTYPAYLTADVASAQRGDTAAFERLYRKYHHMTLNACRRVLRSTPADAEDANQVTWLKVWRKLSTFEGRSTFSTWLYRTAITTSLMRLRERRSGREAYSLDDDGLDPAIAHAALEIPPNQTQDDDEADVLAALDAVMRRLPAVHRKTLEQRYIHDLQHEQIAALEGVTASCIKSRTLRALACAKEIAKSDLTAGKHLGHSDRSEPGARGRGRRAMSVAAGL